MKNKTISMVICDHNLIFTKIEDLVTIGHQESIT